MINVIIKFLRNPALFVLLMFYVLGLAVISLSCGTIIAYPGGVISAAALASIAFFLQRQYSEMDEKRKLAIETFQGFLTAHSALSISATSGDNDKFQLALVEAYASADMLSFVTNHGIEGHIRDFPELAKEIQYVYRNNGPALAHLQSKWRNKYFATRAAFLEWMAINFSD